MGTGPSTCRVRTNKTKQHNTLMNKKDKLKIEDLKVQSFVTSLDGEENRDLQGAATFWFCDTTDGGCNTTSGNGVCGSWAVTKCNACDGGSYFWCSSK